jgi:acyl-CoA synthetase (NDP forming)
MKAAFLSQEKFHEFEPIFYPKSIAVVGASTKRKNMGNSYVKVLLTRGFKGKVYPVNPEGGQLHGLKVYPDVKSIPYPVDYVYVCIPRHLTLDLLDDCAAKGVKVVQFFTAGFSETGEEDGIRLEKELVKKAKTGNFRIIGPNCIGVYSPTINMPYGVEGLLDEAGSTAFVCQSGSLLLRIIQSGIVYRLRFSKAVSFGNGADIDSTDFLEYFAVDPETKVIGAYLEGVKDGRRFLKIVKETSERKPVIVWRGGKTETGTEIASSHTGALARPSHLWTTALKQTGAIEVRSLEELVDTLLAFQYLPVLEDYGISIISGIVDGGGGQSVSAADMCTSLGLTLPAFSNEVKDNLAALVGKVGNILRNPLDISQAPRDIEIVCKAIEIAAFEKHIDLVIIQEHIDFLIRLLESESIERLCNKLADLRMNSGKSIAVALQSGLAEPERLKLLRKLSESQIAVFPSVERAAKAIANMRLYSKYRKIESDDC